MDDIAAIRLSPLGLPGGLGSAPFWGKGLRAGTQEILLDVPRFPLDSVTLEIRPEEGTGCMKVAGVPGPPSHQFSKSQYTSALPWTVLTYPFVLCPGLAFPHSFMNEARLWSFYFDERDQKFVQYVLVEHRSSDRPVSLDSDGSSWQPVAGPVALREGKAPFFVPDSEDPFFRFPLAEAHAKAMEEVAAYRRVFTSDPPGVLYSNEYNEAAGSGGNVYLGTQWRAYHRTLTAVDAQGNLVEVVLEKRISKDLPMSPSQTEITVLEWSDDERLEVYPTSETVIPRQASLRSALQLGENFTGLAFEDDASYSFKSWTNWTGPTVSREAYEVIIYYPDPAKPEPEPGTGLIIELPLPFIVDGPTGVILWVKIPPEKLPFA